MNQETVKIRNNGAFVDHHWETPALHKAASEYAVKTPLVDKWYATNMPGVWQAEAFGRLKMLRLALEGAGLVYIGGENDEMNGSPYSLAQFRIPGMYRLAEDTTARVYSKVSQIEYEAFRKAGWLLPAWRVIEQTDELITFDYRLSTMTLKRAALTFDAEL